jgi:hypothetical protein
VRRAERILIRSFAAILGGCIAWLTWTAIEMAR